MLLGQQVIALDKSSLIEVISAATWPNKFVGATDNKGLATYISLTLIILAATGEMHTTPTNAASHDLTYQGFTYWKVCLQLIVQ